MTQESREAVMSGGATDPQAPVLVAVDLSADSEEALRWACDYAEKMSAPVEVLHVVHDPAESPGKYRPDDDALEPMRDVAERKLAEFLDRVATDNSDVVCLKSATSLCLPGLPAGTILDVAERRGARALVMGGRGRSALSGVLFGSTSQQVTRQATIPVTIVKSKAG